MTHSLPKILTVDKEKCVNCHQCISVCSTKFANDGSSDHVKVIDDLCIGCGECIKACTHEARIPIDDFEQAMLALTNHEKIVAIVAPAIAAQFPDDYLYFNGWLKSLGVEATFDVSFGAELTITSYLNHVTKNKPKAVIAQPCPAIVTYIEIYRPELIPFLAPADSPMMHTAKMIKRFYPKYNKHKILVVSPCLAKKREFDEIGGADFNVTMKSFENYLAINGIDLSAFPKVDFDNEPAERAVLFSTPGGLLSTAERDHRPIRHLTRKIEGPHAIYPYLDLLKNQIDLNRSPLLIDCLNCEKGCNGGTGTSKHDLSADELEYYIHRRKKEMQARYQTEDDSESSVKKLQNVVAKYWDENLYHRNYVNRSDLYSENIRKPTNLELEKVYHNMHKYAEKDHYNCSSCGYNSCEMMAVAIFNNLNKPENCHYYMGHENEEKAIDLKKTNEVLQDQKKELIEQSENLLFFIEKVRNFIN